MNKFKSLIPQDLRVYWRLLLSLVYSLINGRPGRKLKIIGVTGTSGKSTTANMIYHMLKECGVSSGVISTNGVIAIDKELESGLHVTTPDPKDLQKFLKFMVKKKVDWVVLEVSSHALSQGRVGFTKFDHVVITNIKRDHLDWHGTWENYADAKLSITDRLKKGGKIVINRDDKEMFQYASDYIEKNDRREDVISYSFSELQNIQTTHSGSVFTLVGYTYALQIIGMYNVENAMAAINLGHILGLSSEQIKEAINSFRGLVGRMEVMKKEPFVTIVDFAHNTDSLKKSLESARKLVEPGGKLICIFGSAGLRDVEKRYTMGETSGALSDITIITAEDPRIEKLSDINDQILEGANRSEAKLIKRFSSHNEYIEYKEGIKPTARKAVFIFDEESIQNRYDAIELAILNAEQGDVIITEGKGHEQSLCFGTTEYPFTDQDAVKKALQKLPENMRE
ncbi:MAG: UDP-N-acetylmuramoyl-L-alanyl-D-glutamate--2,6-diaminopimelate ligase [Candidatus Dojkabacteria bacterium]|nr:UDP-N-acetylmuramoyl-L-alanyl-D-glutamate--2,6-diaminopimelate ligase [Candidatus Dojkabacteria bacterium]MDQ7020658.1 UDP-N-acetylmuramoyl-L-alanyl-D-glutamate--2,6-diaminopimelate ligase [Candidatus Dojkabacteria bacterium]